MDLSLGKNKKKVENSKRPNIGKTSKTD